MTNATAQVGQVLSDGHWHSPREIKEKTGLSARSVSRALNNIPGIESRGKTRNLQYHLYHPTTGTPPFSQGLNDSQVLAQISQPQETRIPQSFIPNDTLQDILEYRDTNDSGHDSGHFLTGNCGGPGSAHDLITEFYRDFEKQILARHGLFRTLDPLLHNGHPVASVLSYLHSTYYNLEIDKIHFILYDKILRDLILETAHEKKWPVKTNKRQIIIRPPGTPVPLTLQLGTESEGISFYSSNPGNLTWLGKWLGQNFPSHPQIERIVQEVKKPKNKKGFELTLVVREPALITDIELVLSQFYNEYNGLRIASPNTITPGFKAYRKKEVMRIELVCNSDIQVDASFLLMQQFTQAIEAKNWVNTEILKFLDRYYSRFVASYNDPESRKKIPGKSQKKDGNEGVQGQGNHEKEMRWIGKWESMGYTHLDTLYNLDTIAQAFGEIFGLTPRSAEIFIAAAMVFRINFYKRRITRTRIIELIQNNPPTNDEISLAREELLEKGFLELDDDLDFHISNFGLTCFKETIGADRDQ